MSLLRNDDGAWSLRQSIQPTVRQTVRFEHGQDEESEGFREGDVIASAFRIQGLLGTGGMGFVYDAWDERLGRAVAIKVLKRAHSHRGVGILREELALAQIRHPGVCAVYLAGEHDGHSYFVMEKIQGRTLAQVMRDAKAKTGGMPLDEALSVLVSIADVLRVVHEHGIVHRDIKPRNILIAPKGRVVLVDFGLFKPVGANASDIEGTPEYMAPETISCGTIDSPVDLYALGVIAYELLSGHLPFEKPTTNLLLAAHVVERPEEINLDRVKIPSALAAFVLRLLEKDPSCRPSAEEAADTLRGIQREVASFKTGSASVLVVDDDETMRALFQALGRACHAEVQCVGDAEHALAVIQKTPPDLMFLDLHLPSQSGVELMMALRGMRLAQETRVVAMSGRAQASDVALLQLLGVKQYVPKDTQFATEVSRVFAEVSRHSSGRK